MLAGPEGMNALVSNYLSEINANTVGKTRVKNVEDVQRVIGYFNHVIADINAKKKKL
jgi:hypothetical protein